MNVIITGASKGIGYAMAKRLTENQNVRLYLIARSEKLLLQLKEDCLELNPDAEIVTVPFDMTNILKNEWPGNIDCKHIDIMINNAGLLINKNFENLNTDEIIGMATVNFVAPSLLIQKSLSKMGGEHPTHVINISSMGSYQGSVKFPGLSIYSASKAALSVLTECLSVELKEKNIFVNSLALGAVQTEMLSDAFPDYQAPLSPDEMAEFIVDFAVNGYKYFNGKILPVSLSTP